MGTDRGTYHFCSPCGSLPCKHHLERVHPTTTRLNTPMSYLPCLRSFRMTSTSPSATFAVMVDGRSLRSVSQAKTATERCLQGPARILILSLVLLFALLQSTLSPALAQLGPASGAFPKDAAGAAAGAKEVPGAGTVGEVRLVIGDAQLERAGEAAVALRRGTLMLEGDTIRTGASGHVHLRFIDGALLSVRPHSLFVIQEFRYQPQDPAASVVRLSLARGEVRSISGAAAQAAKERFRLNTPLVAIGVKGTDFVTQASADLTLATVNQGAIVMTPFDQNCRADGLGVCGGQRARTLSADMAGLALVYRSGAADPGFQPAPAGRDREGSKLLPLEPALREGAERAVATRREQVRPEEVVVRPEAAVVRPEEPVAAARLLWGRWATTPMPGDTLTVGFREAMSGNEVTVGDGYYFLFREPGVSNLLPGLGLRADFKLGASSAFHRLNSGEIAPASVDAGQLSVNFVQRTFDTRLQLSASGIASQTAQFSGSLDPVTGIFVGGDPKADTRLAGALGLDGRSAGYLFSVPVGLGALQGATLWSR